MTRICCMKLYLPRVKVWKQQQKGNMPRPKSKSELQKLAAVNFQAFLDLADNMTVAEKATEFDFTDDKSKKERHWGRDKNVRDVYVHLYEWHQLLLNWVAANQRGDAQPFLPAPYNWKTYGDMNQEFWEKHQNTTEKKARAMLEKSHAEVMSLLEKFSDEQLFTKKFYPWTGTSNLGAYFISVTSSHYDWASKKLKAHHKNCTGK